MSICHKSMISDTHEFEINEQYCHQYVAKKHGGREALKILRIIILYN